MWFLKKNRDRNLLSTLAVAHLSTISGHLQAPIPRPHSSCKCLGYLGVEAWPRQTTLEKSWWPPHMGTFESRGSSSVSSETCWFWSQEKPFGKLFNLPLKSDQELCQEPGVEAHDCKSSTGEVQVGVISWRPAWPTQWDTASKTNKNNHGVEICCTPELRNKFPRKLSLKYTYMDIKE
jgi:hypothetical protein